MSLDLRRTSKDWLDGLLGSRISATLLICFVLLLFCAVVAAGWWFLLVQKLASPLLAGVLTLLITLAAAYLARQIGQARAQAEMGGLPRRFTRGALPYLFLIPATVFGTLNASFVLFEGNALLRHDISNIRGAYSTLRAEARQALIPKDYADRGARIDALLRNLHEEIVNPNKGNYCGVGPSAKTIIAEIAFLIPNYRTLNGTGAIIPCDVSRAESVYGAYARMAAEMQKGNPAFSAIRGPEKLTFLDELEQHYGQANQDLSKLEPSASGASPAVLLDKHRLYRARDFYNGDVRVFTNLNAAPDTKVQELGILLSKDVNSPVATMLLFFRRMGHPQSWIYLLLALALDWATIFLITRYNVLYYRDPERRRMDPAIQRFHTDPKFLWVNPDQL